MTQNMRAVVHAGYEADDDERAFRADPKRASMEIEFLDLLVQGFPQGARVLDLGSGTGLPYDEYLIRRGLHVTGVDFSPKHLARGRKYVPQAEYIRGDFSKAGFAPETFDAVTAF
jgi:SAM-dependent methyltransferase